MNTETSRTHSRHSFTPMSPSDMFELAWQIVKVEKRYLEPYLTLETLAQEMNVHRNALSAAVNQFAGVIFPVWIATYRIAEVERLAALPENSRASIAKLALQAGFTNRTSFYRVYRSIRGEEGRGAPARFLKGNENK